MVYTVRFPPTPSSKSSLFHNSNVFGSCIIHIYIQGVLNLKKKFRRQKFKQQKILQVTEINPIKVKTKESDKQSL